MEKALEMAEKSISFGEVPVGCLILDENLKVLSSAHNEKEQTFDPTAHAEIMALRKAGQQLKSWRLEGCSVYVTLEPCPLCFYALIQARIKRVIFGAYDPKGGAFSLGHRFDLNHSFEVLGGILDWRCSSFLSCFFKQKRK